MWFGEKIGYLYAATADYSSRASLVRTLKLCSGIVTGRFRHVIPKLRGELL